MKEERSFCIYFLNLPNTNLYRYKCIANLEPVCSTYDNKCCSSLNSTSPIYILSRSWLYEIDDC